MDNSRSFMLVLFFVSLNFISMIESCCPYFQTESFKKNKLPLLNSSGNCQSQYQNLGTSGTFYTGDKWCLELYAGRVYCKYACLQYLNIDATNIECQKIDCGSDPNSASSITVTCSCHGTNVNTQQYSSGTTPPHSWLEAETLFLTSLCSGSASGGGSGGNRLIAKNTNVANSSSSGNRYSEATNQLTSGEYSNTSSTNQETSDISSQVINKNTNVKSRKVIFVINDKAYDGGSENGSSFSRKKLMDMINENLSANDTIDKKRK